MACLVNALQDFVQLRGKRTARFGGAVGPPFEPELQLPLLVRPSVVTKQKWEPKLLFLVFLFQE